MSLKNKIPKSGWAGLTENWKEDALSGFLVSLIALPLCLGIAGASNFPLVMGVVTAIVGGIIVSFFAGSELTIKGPAAGLIVIIAGAVEEFGRGDMDTGWKLTAAVVVCAGIFQIILGWARIAALANFFPLSAIHGMLAAIGIIIISKQIHFAIGIQPSELKGKEPVELIEMVPHSLTHLEWHIALIGILSLIILFVFPAINNKIIKAIPAALVVLLVGIAFDFMFHLNDPAFKKYNPLVNPGELTLGLNADFSGLGGDNTYLFVKYFFLLTIIGSLESILTGKAIDLLDPWKRKAKLSQDLTAVGIGNTISGLLGGLPMISEVARSSANINNGGRTKWANFFHGSFLLIFVVLLSSVISLVPVASLAAMLIFVGYRLASPKLFSHTLKTGAGQLFIFVATIFITLFTDLLIGVFTGILLEFLLNIYNGMSLKNAFRPQTKVEQKNNNEYRVSLSGAGTFSNWIAFEKQMNKIPEGKKVTLDISKAKLLDHTFMENIIHIKDEYESESEGTFCIIGTEGMKKLAREHTAAMKRMKEIVVAEE
ncbi:MAG: SulP family inorganic anion transporter [Bacteroidota bacterium]